MPVLACRTAAWCCHTAPKSGRVGPTPCTAAAAAVAGQCGATVPRTRYRRLGVSRGRNWRWRAGQTAFAADELVQMVPKFAGGLDEVPSLTHLRPILDGVRRARNSWAHSIDGFRQDAHWLNALMEAINRLQGAGEMPPGPSLLSVVREAERGFSDVLDQVKGHLPVESRARTLAERLRDWMRAAVSNLLSDIRIRVTSEVSQLKAGETNRRFRY